MQEYFVSESDGTVTVGVSMLEGSLGTGITLDLSSVSGSALCKSGILVIEMHPLIASISVWTEHHLLPV